MVEPISALLWSAATFIGGALKDSSRERVLGLLTKPIERVGEAFIGDELALLAEHAKAFKRRLITPRKPAANHDIVKALRRAELEAIAIVLVQYQGQAGAFQGADAFLKNASAGLNKALEGVDHLRWDAADQARLQASFEQAFPVPAGDTAFNGAPSEPGAAAARADKAQAFKRQAAEAATLAAIEHVRAWTKGQDFPPNLEARFKGDSNFRGESSGRVSWFTAKSPG